MAMTNKEYQAAYKQRMYEAGYKQVQVWVHKKSEGKAIKLERKMFLKHVEALTAGWSKARLSRLLKDALKYIIERIKQEDI